jgi:hypothetical protein
MKKFISFLVLMNLVIVSMAFADTSRPPAAALEWWLRALGKFEGAKVSTAELPNGTYRVTQWNVKGVGQPNDVQVEAIMNQYDAYLVEDAKEKAIEEAELLKKLDLNNDELATLRRILGNN